MEIGRGARNFKMTVKILFFGPLADISEAKEVYIKLGSTNMLSHIKEVLEKKYLKTSTLPFIMAVNKEHVRGDIELSAGDEIAVMPPFSGG